MGDDPNQAVTDSFGRLHDMDNLYVSGPSLFPSTGAVNPTFTISALASRQADHFLGQVASRSKKNDDSQIGSEMRTLIKN